MAKLLALVKRQEELFDSQYPAGLCLHVDFQCDHCGRVEGEISIAHEVSATHVEAFRNLAKRAHMLGHGAKE